MPGGATRPLNNPYRSLMATTTRRQRMEDLLSLKYRILRLEDPPQSILQAIEDELKTCQHEYNLS